MKYAIKGYKKVEVSLEMEAKNYQEAYVKACQESIEPFEINGESIQSRFAAMWADKDNAFESTIKGIKKHKSESLDLLREVFKRNKGIEFFVVSFSGSGDDGCIDDLSAEPHSLRDVVDEVIGTNKVGDVLEGLVGGFLDDMPINWIDGDGGEGEIRVSLNDKNEFEFDISCHGWEQAVSDTSERVVKLK